MTQTLAPGAPTRSRPGLGMAAVYVLTGFPIAVAAFILLVTGLAVGLGTLPIVVGVGVLAVTLGVARGVAGVERARLGLLRGRPVPRPAYKAAAGGTVGRVVSAGSDPRRWLDLAHGILGFPVAVATFSIVTAWFAGAVAGLGYVLWEWALPADQDTETLASQLGLGDGRLPDVLLTTGLGALVTVTLPFVVRGCAAVQAGLACSMLCGSAED